MLEETGSGSFAVCSTFSNVVFSHMADETSHLRKTLVRAPSLLGKTTRHPALAIPRLLSRVVCDKSFHQNFGCPVTAPDSATSMERD